MSFFASGETPQEKYAKLGSSYTQTGSFENPVSSTVSTVTKNIGAVPGIGSVTQSLGAISGISAEKISSSLLGGAIGAAAGGLLKGGKGAALGALAGGVLGGSAGDLLGQVKNKLSGLISSAGELTGLISNPLRIVERGAADLMGLTGEEYALTQSQYRELSERSSFTNFVDNGYLSPYAGDDSSASKIPNPLRDHNSFNYVITLGVLSAAEYNNPESYRSAGGFKNYVIQSGGGNLDKRYRVFDEVGSGKAENAEYFIDDVEMDAVVAPNPNTRVTLGTSLSFTVTEPYSMGNFVQAIIGAAAAAGYSSYNVAPFCLKIDFKGWNLDGTTDANFLVRPIFVPIQLVNMDFNVSGIGSKYVVKAVPMSETGLTDTVNKTKTSVRANGVICHEVLETNDNSITAAINRQIQDLEEKGALSPYDRYVIAFPKTRTALVDALKVGTVNEAAFTTTPEQREQQRTGSAGSTNTKLQNSNATQKSVDTIVIKPITKTYAVLKSFAENTSLMNEIGLSALNTDTNAPGNTTEAEANAAIDPKTGLVNTASKAAQPADKSRDFQFNQGEKVTDIIEKIILQTKYAAERATAESKNGLKKWFKIDTQVFIDDSPVTESQMGRKPKVYVYSVVPYEIDEATTMSGNSRPQNTKGLKEAAAKQFNYIYTGKNEDILNFDINFNNAFLLTANADFGMTSGSTSDRDAGKNGGQQGNQDKGATAKVSSDAKGKSEATAGTQLDTGAQQSSGTHSNDVRIRIAEMFHDRITNMPVDMATAEMEILGDPFFIPQETGNYVAKKGSKPNVTEDGTMTYQDSSVFCVVNFKTPFDYQIKGATMEMPLIVPGFSGLFNIWAVTNRFSKGRFTQTLKMIRRTGQDDPATTGNSGFVQVDNKVAIANETTKSNGVVGQSGTPSTDCMPAPAADDIRKLMPAVADDVAASLSAEFKAVGDRISNIGNQISTGFEGFAKNVKQIGVAPDLSKIIPRIGAAAAGGLIGNALGGKAGALTGALVGGSLGGSLSNAIKNNSDLGSFNIDAGVAAGVAQAKAAASSAGALVNTAVADISTISQQTQAKVKSLLG